MQQQYEHLPTRRTCVDQTSICQPGQVSVDQRSLIFKSFLPTTAGGSERNRPATGLIPIAVRFLEQNNERRTRHDVCQVSLVGSKSESGLSAANGRVTLYCLSHFAVDIHPNSWSFDGTKEREYYIKPCKRRLSSFIICLPTCLLLVYGCGVALRARFQLGVPSLPSGNVIVYASAFQSQLGFEL